MLTCLLCAWVVTACCPALLAAETNPPVIRVTRQMVASNTLERIQLTVKNQAHGSVHVTVVCPQKDRYHLAGANLHILNDGRVSISLPVKIVVDSDGNDRLVFSTSSDTAAVCRLTLEIGPRFPEKDEPLVDRIYHIPLVDFMPPKIPPKKKPEEEK